MKKNPVRFAEKMRKRPKQRKETFTAEEVKLMLEHLPEDQVGWGIRLMLCTGMRTQELLGLEPRHIAEDGSWIIIEQAVVMEKGSAEIGPPKSQDSYRTVPIPRSVQYCARLLRAVDTKYVWERGKRDKPCNPSYFRKKFKEELEGIEGVRVLTPHTSHNYNFSNWADIWFEHHQDNITATTQENYRYTLRILKDYFGVRPLVDIKAFDIEVFLNALRKEERSDSCIAQCRGMLYQIFHKAEANDLVRKNPVRFADKMRSREPTKRKEAFTAEEVNLLMEKLPKDRIGISIRLLLGTGMRSQGFLLWNLGTLQKTVP